MIYRPVSGFSACSNNACSCSAGISCRCNFTIIGLLPPAVRGLSDITDLYVKAFGKPPVSSRVFIRTRQVIDGWEDDPVQTTAIVPGP